MRLACGALIVAAVVCGACSQTSAEPERGAPVSQDLVLEPIETSIIDEGDNVIVQIRWVLLGPMGADGIETAAPVFLFNGERDFEARPDGPPTRTGDQLHVHASVRVPRIEWAKGCWQVHYRLENVIGSGPIECLNQQAAPANH